jgi:hypothetical protein
VKIDVPTGVVAFSASPITVNAGVSDVVVIRGMRLKALTAGTGNGIDFLAGGVLFIENCVLDSWDIGINVTSPNSKTFVSDTVSRNNGGSGLEMNEATALASVVNSRFENNTFVSGGPCGVTIKSGKASIRASVASGNTAGFCDFNSATADLTVEDSLAASNVGAGIEVFNGVVRISNNTVTANGTGLRQVGDTLESRGNNTVRGNGTDTSGTITELSPEAEIDRPSRREPRRGDCDDHGKLRRSDHHVRDSVAAGNFDGFCAGDAAEVSVQRSTAANNVVDGFRVFSAARSGGASLSVGGEPLQVEE